MTAAVASPDRLDLPVRRARNWIALAVILPPALAALWLPSRPDVDVSYASWWVWVFPLLAAATAYRLVRPKVPVSLRPEGVRVHTGRSLLGLRTMFAWTDVARLRISPAGLLLVELRRPDDWTTDKPWLVRANVRLSRRQTGAAANARVKDLVAPAGGLVPALRSVSPVPVEEGARR